MPRLGAQRASGVAAGALPTGGMRPAHPPFQAAHIAAAVRATHLPCRNAGKAQKFALVRRFIWGNPGLKGVSMPHDKVSRADITECSATCLLEDQVLHYRAVSLLSLCFLTLAACGQNTGSGEKSEQATAGLQGPAGAQGPPGPQGPAGPAGGNGSVIHFQQVGCPRVLWAARKESVSSTRSPSLRAA